VASLGFSTVLTDIYVEKNSQRKIHMILEAKFITKENSKEFSNMFLDDTIKCTVHKAYQTWWDVVYGKPTPLS